MRLKKLIMAAMASLLVVLPGCETDEDATVTSDNATQMREFLSGDIVLSTKATMSGVDKTLLESGCPTKFTFTWVSADTCNIALPDFTVGKMPLVVNFRCNVSLLGLNSWEVKEYGSNDDWVKFYGQDGETWSEVKDGSSTTVGETSTTVKGSFVQGYYCPSTHQIQFIVTYNMMNVRSECVLQVVDKSRIDNFEAEKEQYEKDLAEYKKANGLD